MEILYTPSEITGYAKSYKLGDHPLKAGRNEVGDGIKNHPRFDRLVSTGVLIIMDAPPDGIDVPTDGLDVSTDASPEYISVLPYKEAIEFIDTIDSRDVLLELRGRETRVRVLSAIDKRLELKDGKSRL